MRRCGWTSTFWLAAFAAGAMAAIAGCASAQITGAGSTFDFPFFSRAFYEYGQTHSDVQVNYQSIGSGGGIQQFTARAVDFGASDVPMNPEEMRAARAANGDVVQVPVALGGVVVAYSVPGSSGGLRLDQQTLANIFLGKIVSWDDPAIATLNPQTHLPHLHIIVVHRADGSGTTYIFTDYLAKVSAAWKSAVGTAKVVSWPAGSSVGAKGNEGVAGQIKNTPGAVGYIELAYAEQNGMGYASLRNREGAYILPTPETVRTAAAHKPTVSPDDFSIVDMVGRSSYPIAGYSWVMLWKHPKDAAKGRKLVDLFRWLATDGQTFAERLGYVGLPKDVQSEIDQALASIQS